MHLVVLFLLLAFAARHAGGALVPLQGGAVLTYGATPLSLCSCFVSRRTKSPP